MTKKSQDPRHQLRRLSDLVIEDLLNTTDAEILSEAAKSSVQNPGDMAKAAYQRALRSAGQKRLQAARDAIDGEGDSSDSLPKTFDIQKARRLLEKLAANDPEFGRKITLAARNLKEISDAEVLEIIGDLRRLGVLPEDSQL